MCTLPNDETDEDADLARLVSIPYVVETLDALANKRLTLSELRAILHTSRRRVSRALRALAARGAVRRHNRHGSWDLLPPAQYDLTDHGRTLVAHLEHLDVWQALYERYLPG